MRQLREFAQQADEFKKLGARLVAVTSDGQEHTRLVWERNAQKRFSILSDSAVKVIREYGLLHERGQDPSIAIRTTFVLDAEGRVRWFEVSETVAAFPKPEKVLEVLRAK
jgi:peroxiredoxin